MTEREFASHLETGEWAPLYLLHGEEQFLVERNASRLVDLMLRPEDRDFNLDRFHGSDCTGEEILNAALSLPVFSDRRVVWIRHAEALSSDTAQRLIPCVVSPNPSTSLIFQAEKVDLRKGLFTELKNRAVFVEFKRPREGDLARFIAAEARSQGKGIDQEAAELLALLVGPNLQELAGQIEKCALHAGEKKSIGVSDVKSVVTESRVETIFALTDAIGSRNTVQALKAYSLLVRENTSPVYVVTMIIRYVRQLLTVRSMIDRGVTKIDPLVSATGLSPFIIGKILPAARNFGLAELRGKYPLLLAADLNVKGGSPDPVLSVEQLIVGICAKERG